MVFGERHGEGDDRPDVDPRALEAALGETLASAAAAWPELLLDHEEYVRHLALGLPPGADPLEYLPTVHAAELYLAAACAAGAPGAAEAFEATQGPQLDRALRRLDLSATRHSELRQQMLGLLLVGERGRPPQISKYSGRGSLGGWLRVTVTRGARKQLGRKERMIPASDQLLERMADQVDDDPEMQYIKGRYRGEFKAAFVEAVGTLSARERTVLRCHLVDRLSIEDIGSMYNVHRATAARWISGARAAAVEQTRQAMMRRLRIPDEEYESILRLIRSRIDLSLSRHLRTQDPARK